MLESSLSIETKRALLTPTSHLELLKWACNLEVLRVNGFYRRFGSGLRRSNVRFEKMTLEERLQKIVSEDDYNAYMLLQDAGSGDWREEPELYNTALAKFRETFDQCVKIIKVALGPTSYIEHEYSKRSPDWAPMGLYADWAIENSDSIICIFMGGDGNPEDPMMLIGGRTTRESRLASNDPWSWQWIE